MKKNPGCHPRKSGEPAVTNVRKTAAGPDRREAQIRILTEHTRDTVARYDRGLVRTYANPAFAASAGLSVEALLGKRAYDLNPTPAGELYESTIREVFETGEERELLYPWCTKGRRRVISRIRIVPERNGKGETESVLTIGQEIEREPENKEEPLFSSRPDTLTGLPDRITAKEAFALAEDRGERIALFLVEAEGIEAVNELLGPRGEKRIQQAVAARLNRCIRFIDTLCHLGGSTFLLVIHRRPLRDGTQQRIACLERRFAAPFHVDGHDFPIFLSTGIVRCPEDGSDFETVLHKAYSAMLEAKNAEGSSHRFHNEIIKPESAIPLKEQP